MKTGQKILAFVNPPRPLQAMSEINMFFSIDVFSYHWTLWVDNHWCCLVENRKIGWDDEDSQDDVLMKRADNGALTKTMAPSCPTLGAGGEPPKGDVKDNTVTRYWDGDVNDSKNENDKWWWQWQQQQQQQWQWQQQVWGCEGQWVSKMKTHIFHALILHFWIQMRKKKIYKSNKIVKCFLVSFLLVNGRRNWGQLNKWAVLHFPSNIVQITCHCYNEKEHTILPNVTWRAKVQSNCICDNEAILFPAQCKCWHKTSMDV